MYASVRRWRLDEESIDEALHLVDERLADQFAEQPGFVAYQVIDCGDGTACSITVFETELAAHRSNEVAARFVRDELLDFGPERLAAYQGEVKVSRARHAMLEPAHA
jgi:hypothetical protein